MERQSRLVIPMRRDFPPTRMKPSIERMEENRPRLVKKPMSEVART